MRSRPSLCVVLRLFNTVLTVDRAAAAVPSVAAAWRAVAEGDSGMQAGVEEVAADIEVASRAAAAWKGAAALGPAEGEPG